MNCRPPLAGFLLFFLSGTSPVFAQQVVVLDLDFQEPIENVALYNQDRSVSTLTDRSGKADIGKFGSSDSIYLQHPSYEPAGYTRYELANGPGRILLEKRMIMMEEFVISALKGREKLSEIPYMTDILEPDVLAMSHARTGAEILLETGNVMVQQSQGGGGSPILRGFEANKILLVVDGVRMNNAIYRSGHLQNSITIDNHALERVEILYGPSSILYGSDALGGVIHYYTRIPDPDTLHAHVYSGFSTANRGKTLHADMNLGRGRVAHTTHLTIRDYGDIRTGQNRRETYGDWGLHKRYVRRIGGTDSTVLNPEPHIQKNTGYTQYDFLSKTRYSPSQRMELTLNLQLSTSSEIDRFDQLNDPDGENMKYAEWYYGPQNRFLGALHGAFRQKNDFFDQLTATLAFQKIDEDRITRKFRQPDKLFQEEDVQLYSAGFDFLKRFGKGRLYYGAEYAHNRVRSSARYEDINSGAVREAMSRYPGGGNQSHCIALYGNFKRDLGAHSLLDGGLRYQYDVLQSTFDDQNLPVGDIDIRNGALTGSASLVFNPDNTWQYNLILATGFRNPNVDDYGKVRAKGGLITVPNEDLRSEYTYNVEAGTRKTFPGYLTISGSFFFSLLTNAIVRTDYSLNGSDSLFYDGDYYRIITNSNASQAGIGGISLSAVSRLQGPLSFRGTLNYLQGKDITNDTPLGHIPPLFGRISMEYNRGRFTGQAALLYSGKKPWPDLSPFGEDNEEEALPGKGYPSWYTVNLKTAWKPGEHFELKLGIENLFDRFYKTFASGVAAPGRNFIFSLQLNLSNFP